MSQVFIVPNRPLLKTASRHPQGGQLSVFLPIWVSRWVSRWLPKVLEQFSFSGEGVSWFKFIKNINTSYGLLKLFAVMGC